MEASAYDSERAPTTVVSSLKMAGTMDILGTFHSRMLHRRIQGVYSQQSVSELRIDL
jgi:hypothetical protein